MTVVLHIAAGERCQTVAWPLALQAPFAGVHGEMLDRGYALCRLATVKRLCDGTVQARLVWRRRADGCCAVMTGRLDGAAPVAPALLLALAA